MSRLPKSVPIVCVDVDAEIEDHQFYRVRSFMRTSKGLVSLGDSYRSRSISNCSHDCPNLSINLISPEHNYEASQCSLSRRRITSHGETTQNLPAPHRLSENLPEQIYDKVFLSPTFSNAFPRVSMPANLQSSSKCAGLTHPVKVQIIGGHTVGKTTLCRQFLTSEFIGEKNESFSDDNSDRFIIIEVDGWNRSLMLIDNFREDFRTELLECGLASIQFDKETAFAFPRSPRLTCEAELENNRKLACVYDGEHEELTKIQELNPISSNYAEGQNLCGLLDVDVYLAVYGVDDEASFKLSKSLVLKIQSKFSNDSLRIIYLVGNKTDLVRKRQVSKLRGKKFAKEHNCIFFEISTAINHLVDELLVDIVIQWRSQTAKLDMSQMGLLVTAGGNLRQSSVSSGRRSWVTSLTNSKNQLQQLIRQQFIARSCINLKPDAP